MAFWRSMHDHDIIDEFILRQINVFGVNGICDLNLTWSDAREDNGVWIFFSTPSRDGVVTCLRFVCVSGDWMSTRVPAYDKCVRMSRRNGKIARSVGWSADIVSAGVNVTDASSFCHGFRWMMVNQAFGDARDAAWNWRCEWRPARVLLSVMRCLFACIINTVRRHTYDFCHLHAGWLSMLANSTVYNNVADRL